MKMKDVINLLVAQYGWRNFRYSFVVYGSEAHVRDNLNDVVLTENDLKFLIQETQRESGNPLLGKALNTTDLVLFEGSSRTNATKVIVLILDNR